MAAGQSGSTVLITGASGLLGMRIGTALARRHRVIGIDLHEPRDASWMTFHRCDMTDGGDVQETIDAVARDSGGRLTSVIHLAAYYDFSGEPSPLYDTLTVGGTRHLLRALQPLEVEQFVFSSSMLVLAPSRHGERLDEESPTAASWDYPRSKIAAEQAIAAEHGSIPAVILRIAGVYDDEGHSLPIAQQIKRIRERELESYLFPGDADHGQSFVHLDDVVSCVEHVIAARARLGALEVFVIGEEEVLSYRELQDRLGQLLHGKEWPTVRIPTAVAKAGAWLKDKLPGQDSFIKPWMIEHADAHYPLSIARARDRLGWTPQHRLADSLAPIVETLQRDPRAWYERHRLPLAKDLRRPDERGSADAGG